MKIIVEYIRKEGSVSVKQVSKIWKITGRTARKRLIKMIEDEIAVKIGLAFMIQEKNMYPSLLPIILINDFNFY